MAEPTITCPNCKTEIKLNESLAGPLLEATRRDFEKRLKQKDTDLAATLKEEATKIAVEEARKAKLATSNELEQKTRAVAELEKNLTENNAKLAEAQKAQADLLRKQRELDTKLREADLSVEKRVQEGLNATREQARKEVESELKLKIHPFREGNGRCARLLATLMGLQAGLPALDFGGIRRETKRRYIGAVHAGLDRDYRPMTAIFRGVIARSLRAQATASSAKDRS